MLERASSCLEPAAQNLFRSIEAPTRSQRRLPQAFWRHTRRTREHRSWWPAYLDDVRRATRARDEALLNGTCTLPPLPFAPKHWVTAEGHTASTIGSRRHISKIVKQSRVREDKEFQDALEAKDEVSLPVEVEIFGPDGILEPFDLRLDAEKTPSERLEDLLRAGGESQYNAVYLAFVSLKEPARLARAVLRYLSRSPSTVVLRRALRIYQIVEVEDRTHLTYESAVRAAVGLRKYGTAGAFVLEALERGLGHESSQFLMGHLVEKEMWKSAFQTLQIFKEHAKDMNHGNISNNEHVERNTREAPVWKTVDGMLALPRRLITLCTRLKEEDAVLASNRPDMEYLATRLLERALRSTTIMAAITPEGVLALFDSYRRLGLLQQNHYLDSLNALRQLRDFRNRSPLALLIFRNMRWQYPENWFRESTYGTMISIMSAAPNEPDAFDYVLEDLRTGNRGTRATTERRKPDLAMYQRVMSACAEQGHTAYVKVLRQKLISDHGIVEDLAYLTPVLLSSAKRGDISETQRSFDELSAKYSLKPDIICWNILLLAYAKADDFDGAAALFRQMQSLEIPADLYTFGTLMSMCSNAGDTRAVLQLVNMAREKHIPASTAMIDTVVHTYCLNGEAKEAESLVEAATQMSLSGSPTRMWNILLRHYAFRGDSASVLRTQERMRDLAVKPDGMTYAALMTSLVVMSKTTEAAAVLRSLHLGQVVSASRFHYSIVIHGYVQEGNYAMAMVVYTEMLRRFARPSPSARLAIMHLQSKRDQQRARTKRAAAALEWTGKSGSPASPLQKHPIEFLADALLEMADTEAIPNEPQPGFQRRQPILVTPAIYLEVSVAVLNSESSYKKAEQLLSRYQATIDATIVNKQQKSHHTVQILTAHMRGLVRSFEGSGSSTAHLNAWSRRNLDAIWSKILKQTVFMARERRQGLLRDFESQKPASALPGHSRTDLHFQERSSLELVSVAAPTKPSDKEVDLFPTPYPFDVLPAKRYSLSVPLSVYMRGLALQKRFSKLHYLIQEVQDIGFELSSKNWNTYIQVLSQNGGQAMQAFRIFEQKLLPSLPSWTLLKRGLVWFSREDQLLAEEGESTKPEKSLFSRPTVEKLHPGQLMPTYFTVIHLAAAFIKAFRKHQAEEGDGASLYSEIRRHAPETVKYIQDMPHIKDRVQGVLIRGRAVKGDYYKRPRKPERVDQAALLGSKSLLDGVSPEQLTLLKESNTTDEDLRALFDETEGPIIRGTLIRRGQGESLEAYEQRIRSQERNQDTQIQKLRTELQQHDVVLMADEVHGEPHVEGLPAQEEAAPLPDSLLKSRVERLRALADEPEVTYPRWRFRSRFEQVPRIKAYASKQPQQLLRPMGDYKHKSPVFTRSMLTRDIPKRRKFARETVAFNGWKAFKELRKRRDQDIRRARAGNRRMRRQERWEEGWEDQESATDDISESIDDQKFLESRLPGRQQQQRQAVCSIKDGIPRECLHDSPEMQSLPPEAEPAPETPHSAKTDPAALRAMLDEDRKARKRPQWDVDHVKEVDDNADSMETRLVSLSPARRSESADQMPFLDQDSTRTSEHEERADTPFGPVKGFDEFAFVSATPSGKKDFESSKKDR